MTAKSKTLKPELDISVVIPLFNEEENVGLLHNKLDEVLSKLKYKYEIIFIDDGSNDTTFERLRVIVESDPHVKAIKFRANCGQSAATDAGFELAKGAIIIVMDGDLQNDPKDIPNVLRKMDEGFDVVSGWRKNRQDKFVLRKFPSMIANRLICSVTKVNLHDTGCALKAYRYDIVKRINLYGELHRFLPALAKVEGARISEIPVDHHARQFGQSKYGISRIFKVIMDLMSLNLFLKYLRRPIHFFGNLGILFLLCNFIGCIALIQGFVRNVYGMEEFNIIITIIILFFSSGLQFLFLGLIASLIFVTGNKKSVYLSSGFRNSRQEYKRIIVKPG